MLLGQDTGLADVVQRRCVLIGNAFDLDRSALALDPGFIRAQRGMATMQMKVGNAELGNDPVQALKDFQLALKRFDALPASEQSNVPTLRSRGITLRKVATAYSELGDYAQAAPFFEQALSVHQHLMNADPKDIRNLADLERALSDQAASDEYAENPALNNSAIDQRQYLQAEEKTLQQDQEVLETALRITPSDPDRRAELAHTQARQGTVQWLLHEAGDSAQISKSALAELRTAAGQSNASPHIIFLAVTAFLQQEPVSLRDPQFAVACAERGVALAQRKDPEWLLVLAQAHHAAGNVEMGHAAAQEGLVLLPAAQPGSPAPNIRKLLEIETQ